MNEPEPHMKMLADSCSPSSAGHPLLSLAKKSIASATSDGCPGRFITFESVRVGFRCVSVVQSKAFVD